MAQMDFIEKQFIEILERTESGDGTLAWRYPMAGNEIRYGGSLTVRESRMAEPRLPSQSTAPVCAAGSSRGGVARRVSTNPPT